MADDDEDRQESCIGNLCFLHPYPHYTPPPYYPRTPRREYRWKIGAQVKATPEAQCKISHSVTLPNILGLGLVLSHSSNIYCLSLAEGNSSGAFKSELFSQLNSRSETHELPSSDNGEVKKGPEARWRWQWIPISLMTSVIMHLQLHQSSSTEATQRGGISNTRRFRVGISPRACLKVLTPVFGKLALVPMVELLPKRVLILRRHFCVGSTKLSVQANLQVGNMWAPKKWPHWSLQVNWHPADAVKLLLQPEKNVFEMQYSRSFNLTPECKGVATGVIEVLSKSLRDGGSGFIRRLPLRARLDSFKVSHRVTDKAAKTALPTSTYLKASRRIGTRDLISVIPGHWLDPGFETGAPGERDFNMDVANLLERQLMGNGWKVLRPDRDAPNLTWEEYLNWVSKQTSQGIPTLEIHGQGSQADYRGVVLGVIGDPNTPLNKELTKDFGYYGMDWRELGVSKRGGVVLETFNADEVLQMAPWHRKWSARRLANRIVNCIEQASHDNRISRGVIIEGDDDDLFGLDRTFSGRRR